MVQLAVILEVIEEVANALEIHGGLVPDSERLDRRSPVGQSRSMIKDAVIVKDWHVVWRAAELPEGVVRKVRLLGEDLVIWRSGGRAMAWMDLCIHRGVRFTMC